MSNIGFMRATTNYIVELYRKYFNNKRSYPSSTEKQDYVNFVWQMERLYRYGEIEDEKEYKELMRTLSAHNITQVVERRKGK